MALAKRILGRAAAVWTIYGGEVREKRAGRRDEKRLWSTIRVERGEGRKVGVRRGMSYEGGEYEKKLNGDEHRRTRGGRVSSEKRREGIADWAAS